ncbi:MAG: LysR family transcriptional regulator [Oscillospiraceae bacterium]|nr:LysR family transcriptional regulator [Oscillospiraceae bacterium]
MIDLELLAHFISLTEDMNLTKTARRLYITQPTLSRQMAGLEKQLGVSLFIRDGHSVSLTPTGELLKVEGAELLNHAATMIENLLRKDQMADQPKLTINTFTMTSQPFYRTLIDYYSTHPKVVVTLNPLSGEAALKMVNNGVTDIAYVTSMSLDAAPDEEKDLLKILPVRQDYLCAVVMPDHPLAKSKNGTCRFSDLLYYNLVRPIDPTAECGLLEELHRHGIQDCNVSCENGKMLRFKMQHEQSVALLLGSAVRDVSEVAISLKIEDSSLGSLLSLVWKRNNPNQEIQNFIECLEHAAKIYNFRIPRK